VQLLQVGAVPQLRQGPHLVVLKINLLQSGKERLQLKYGLFRIFWRGPILFFLISLVENVHIYHTNHTDNAL
jgi:hypothetical protein